VVKEIKGIKFGFLGFDFISKKPSDFDYEIVNKSNKNTNVLIVGVHWGEEYNKEANQFQKDTARKLVDAGADVVVGHHPHWAQDGEYISGKPVYYSLGNFVFDQMWSKETKKGLVMKLVFKGGELIKEEKLPINIFSLGQPEFAK